ncbi:Ovarian cancer-associated protein 2 [Geranomyces variabilis]|uniref:Ovarian cancer-associated protein 2 n=1 Tax=Geranomyces variabilis TaxID=109894 RepID=A0AAD5TPS2_9FUNG|nr:Ovarian cancer-associated protein 2 [Geranomyces variabilis]
MNPTPAVSSTTPARRLRILCLHGYTQNKDVFRSRIAVIRKDLKNVAEFDFISAPHIVSSDQIPGPVEATDGDGPRSWWNPAARPSGLDASLSLVSQTWSTASPPYDGILGFSQGATMAALALPTLDPPARFSLHFAGFYPVDPAQMALLSAIPATRVSSLHVMGRADAWVTPARSEALRARFQDPQTLVHDGGHFVPTNAGHRQTYREFVGKFAGGGSAAAADSSPSVPIENES